jgi:hypothetical protein
VSDPIDIKALDEYLKGGSDISQRYRELGREDVPPDLDRRVLAEARAAVAGGGAARSRSWLRWSAPVALAASVVLVVAVVIESPVQDATLSIQPASEESAQARQQEPDLQIVPEQPPAAAPSAVLPAAPPPASAAKAEAKRADRAPVVEEVLVNAQVSREQSFAPTPVAVDSVAISARNEADRSARLEDSSAKASASTVLQEAVVTGTRQRRSAGRTAGPRNTISGSAFETRPAADADADADTDADAEQSDPAKWLEEIRDLRRAGKTAEADAAWERFREAFPDFPVAQDDVALRKP